ncbi:MAG: sugar ABC transporter permease [Candidatus Eisenbacteria bacterium]|uniref:Sugar ABC transporter permease n=1 Tax=Eiseniibacteriota bacterium TaxID=2212470 RepID=A0A849SF41_UNCEI|nr:sugar ABC transporter permease [Candidatus Eisenbacteria bacterium]
MRTHSRATAWAMLSPWLLSFVLFGLYPFAFTLVASFTSYSPLEAGGARFVGFENYLRALTDPEFWNALRTTGVFVIGTIPFTTALALGLALAVQPAFRGRTMFRVGFFVPSVVSIVVLSLVFKGLYAPNGFVNAALHAVGLPAPAWLLDPRTALPAIMAMDVWTASGYYMVIFLAGLEAIPHDLYDAARIEGASNWIQFTRITLPLLRPTLLFVLVVNTVRSLQIFAEAFVMTGGGPLKSTTTVVYYLYEEAFTRFHLGYASAVAYLLFAITLVLAWGQMKLVKPSGEPR